MLLSCRLITPRRSGGRTANSSPTPCRWTWPVPAAARRFFDNWKQALKWQRLPPYRKFTRLVDRHWDGIAAYCQPQNKVPLGFVKGLNNKIRVVQRRACGLRDEDYLRLKILI